MEGTILKLYVVKRRLKLEVLYYCPLCESVNEVFLAHLLDVLKCRECAAALTAEDAVLEIVEGGDENLKRRTTSD